MNELDTDPDGPDHADADLLDESDTDTVACPACGAQIYEHADRCNACGEWIVHRSSIWSRKALWWIILAILGIAAVVYVYAF